MVKSESDLNRRQAQAIIADHDDAAPADNRNARLNRKRPVALCAFDLLRHDGRDLSGAPDHRDRPGVGAKPSEWGIIFKPGR
jgi:hypothetical protein